MYFIRRTTRPECAGITTNLQIVLNNPKKSLLKSSHLKKYLPNFPTLPPSLAPPPPPPSGLQYIPSPATEKIFFFPLALLWMPDYRPMFTQKYFARLTDYKTKRKICELGSGRHRKQRDEIHLRVIWDCFSFVVLCFLFFFQAPCDCNVLL